MNKIAGFLKRSELIFRTEMTGYHSGQKDLKLVAMINGQTVGSIEYSEFRGRPKINMISVIPNFRGKGIGKKLVLQLQKEYPRIEIEWGMKTPDGERLYNSVKNLLYVDKKRIKRLKKIKTMKRNRQKLDDYIKNFHKNKRKLTPEEIEESMMLDAKYSELDNRIYEMERHMIYA
jgi:GNAT superfamily N-acetyltransferase